MAITFEQVFPYQYVNTPYGRKAVDGDGNIIPDSEVERMRADFEARQQRSADITAGRMDIEAGERARAQAEFDAGAGGVPWTASEMASGLSGAPRSNIPLDEELPVRRLKPEPVNLGENAADYGWTQVGSGEIERDPKTGKAKRAGAYTVAAPAPEGIRDIPLDAEGMDDMLAETVDPNAQRREDLERAGYRRVLKNTPDGKPVWVYSTRSDDGYTDSNERVGAMRGKNGRQMGEGMSGGTEYQREARIQRMADKLGKTPEQIEKMLAEGGEVQRGEDPAGTGQVGYNSFAAFNPVRRAIATQRGAEKKAKADAAQAAIVRRAQSQQNLQEWFNNPTVTPEQRQLASAILLRRGATPNDIAAAQAEGVQRGFALGARQTLNVNDPNMQRELMELNRRKNDPSHAGTTDIASGRPDSPEAVVEIDRLAEGYDDTWGGFSWDNERALAARLRQPPYNMSQPEAEAAANRAANKRRRPWNQGRPPAQGQQQAPPQDDGRLPDGSPRSDAWFPL